jgi:hypothetical protein
MNDLVKDYNNQLNTCIEELKKLNTIGLQIKQIDKTNKSIWKDENENEYKQILNKLKEIDKLIFIDNK